MSDESGKTTTTVSHTMLINAAILGLFAVIGTALLAYTHNLTKQRVDDNIKQHTLKKLHELVPASLHDNDMEQDQLEISHELLGDGKMIIYRARWQSQPVAAILQCIAPDGYSGKVKLLVAVDISGVLKGVRVIEHLETPGLGDAIETHKSNWIHQFSDKSLQNPGDEKWKVKRDGGSFDQITSATITSRAVVKATYQALEYFRLNQQTIFK